ncbi:PAS domain-containing sensor histidine kinase [Mesorhizobium sp. BR1-1-16]|uniref:PAS domain-containing sensor histidine kinase n=1 Tax=Mesorhizobium sp. BR1-1-16 TaxID=2876653 RepID=UPI001CCA986E|nr:PAS domain-containing sensor histidine kinase [Mesorhizobium sp. BR1-1-16]MBZ9934969.1 PAS domain-containing sensor histidine kinase [Mesorhizobium sp. BR1-1-16]
MTVSFEPLRRIMDGLVHGSATGDALVAGRHRAFIAAHLAAGLAALMAMPLWLAFAGLPSPAIAVAFLWLVTPLPIAAFLSRTGRYADAHLLSALSLTGLVGWIAAFTGGLASPALAWFAVVPAEAALSGSRRVVVSAAALAAAALAILWALASAGLSPDPLGISPLFAPAVVGGAVLYAVLVAIRIETVHSEASVAARLGDTRYRLLADNATDLITRHTANGDVAFASPAARALVGCPPADLVGQGLFYRVHIADRPAFLRALSEADRTGASITAEFRLRSGAGEGGPYLWAEMRCRPVIDPASGRTVIAVTRDISSRKAQETAFAEARSAAEQANRAKSQFLANMSHELRTPLNAIIGFSDILEQQLFGRFEFERHRDYARLIRSSGEHLLDVVNSILDMSKIEAGRFEIHVEPVAVAGLVDGAIEMMSHQIASRQLKVVRRVEPGLPDIVADRRACKQILLNLISNAVKFTEAGGSITIASRQGRDGVVIEVVDTGIGISADDLPRLGTPFVQADSDINRRYEGTGLGLSVVKGLVHLHGGTMAIASEPGRGTSVSVTLPADKAKPAAEWRASGADEVAFERERRIA